MADPEYRTMIKCIRTLVTVISGGPGEIADALLSNQLISPESHERMSLPHLTDMEKARVLVKNVTSNVQSYPRKDFTKFLDTLRDCTGMGNLVETLEDKFDELNGTRVRECNNLGRPAQVAPRSSTRESDAEKTAIAALTTEAAKRRYDILVEKIPMVQRCSLDNDIEPGEHTRRLAEKLVGWEDKPDLLGLSHTPDVSDITTTYTNEPFKQRFAALDKWKNKHETLYPTYRSLLCICVQGEWMNTANEIVTILTNM